MHLAALNWLRLWQYHVASTDPISKQIFWATTYPNLPGEEKMRIRLLLLALADLRASCFAALWGMLAMGLGVMAWPGEALAWTGQPLVYVTGSDGISVIDTGDNEVVDTIPGFASPIAPGFAFPIAVAPDGNTSTPLGPPLRTWCPTFP